MERLTSNQVQAKNGLYYEPNYQILCRKLCDMKRRCNNPNDPSYPLYGGRGIKVCEDWSGQDGHKNFYLWAIKSGYEKGLSIDRIDNDGDYSPGNCRWATPKEQSNNTRRNRTIRIGNVTKTVTEWSRIFDVDPDLSLRRFRRGYSIEDIFSPPTVSTKPRCVIRTTDDKIYASVRDAARDCNGDPDKVRQVCRGKRKTHKGHSFRFLTREEAESALKGGEG